jgi:transcriptional regulator with XRE-family HTH domain
MHRRFIELRANERTLEEISAEIGVSRPTLSRWDKRFRMEIFSIKSDRMMEWARRVRTPGEELQRMAANLNRVEIALEDKEDIRDLPTEKLFNIASRLRADMRHTHKLAQENSPAPSSPPAPTASGPAIPTPENEITQSLEE